MGAQFIGLQAWLQSPAGQRALQWQQAQYDEVVADIFGYYAVQLGVPALDALRANRMTKRWLVAGTHEVETEGPLPGHTAFACEFASLPLPAQSVDLLVLPHALELAADPHAALREAERVLVPEGRIIISGFNPVSLWGLRQWRAHLWQRVGWDDLFLPDTGEFIRYQRLRDWMRLLSFEVEVGRFGCYLPAVRSPAWIERLSWMDRVGARWWRPFGAVYFLVGVKRVRGVRLMTSAAWRRRRSLAGAPVPIANQTAPMSAAQKNHLESRSQDR